MAKQVIAIAEMRISGTGCFGFRPSWCSGRRLRLRRDVLGAGAEGIGQGNVTNWELHQVVSNRAFGSKATFYLGGTPVDINTLLR